MERRINLEDISDGRLYGLNDMVKADCNDCVGCSACCRNMGNSIVLDPFDIYQLTIGLKCKFDDLLVENIELNVVDGIILPNLKMDSMTGSCSFLNEEGRCKIHSIRPGICRIFPLGRVYENNTFQYFLQVQECKKQNRSKVKVKKWIDIKDVLKNEKFIIRWHYFIKNLGEKFIKKSESIMKQGNMYILNLFFITPYKKDRDFYEQFEERIIQAEAFFEKFIV